MASEENNVTAESKEVQETVPDTKAEIKEKEAAAEKPETPAPAPPPPAPTPHKCNFEKDIVYLYQFTRTPVVPSLSPFCLKVETWLRLAGLKYENVDHKLKFRSKKGQLPFVELNGVEIADSSVIIKELGQHFSKDLDIILDNSQKNVSHAMISMIENHLFWVMMYWRTKSPDNLVKGYKINLQHVLGTRLPNGLLNFFFKFSYGRKGLKKIRAHGIGVHTGEEILEFGKQDLKVLSELLEDKPFFFGDEPTMLDVVAFANLAMIYFVDNSVVSFPLKEFMQESCGNLGGFVNRMKEKCFQDWDLICSTLDLNAHLPKPIPEEKEKEKAKDEEKKAEKEGDEKDKDEKSEKEIEKEKEKDKDTDENKEKEKEKEEK